jgi:hypothetical protein
MLLIPVGLAPVYADEGPVLRDRCDTNLGKICGKPENMLLFFGIAGELIGDFETGW